MDPISITLAIAPVLTKAAKTIKACHDILEKYRSAPTTLALIITECNAIAHVLSELQLVVLKDLPRLDPDRRTSVCDYINGIVIGSTNALSTIEERIESLRQSSEGAVLGPMRFLSRKDKVRVVWKEDEINSLLLRLRGYQQNIGVALQLLSVESDNTMREMVEMQGTVLTRIEAEVMQRQSRRRQSIMGESSLSHRHSQASSVMSDTSFEFDIEALNTRIYREAFIGRRRQVDAEVEDLVVRDSVWSARTLRSLAISETTVVVPTSPRSIEADVSEKTQNETTPKHSEEERRVEMAQEENTTTRSEDALSLEIGKLDDAQLQRDTVLADLEAFKQNILDLSKNKNAKRDSIPSIRRSHYIAPDSLSLDAQVSRRTTGVWNEPRPATTRPLLVEKTRDVGQEVETEMDGPKPTSPQLVAAKTIPPTGTIKCVLVGDKAQVKTKMLITYTRNGYPSDYVPAVFDNYSTNIMIDDEVWTLALFDTAQEEDYDNLRHLSYLHTDVFIICAEIGKKTQYESARDKWAPDLQHYCAGVPYLLAGVRCPDEEQSPPISQFEPDKEYGESMAKTMGAKRYLQCDLITQYGLKQVFDHAIAAALGTTIGPALSPSVKRLATTKKTSRWRRSRSKADALRAGKIES